MPNKTFYIPDSDIVSWDEAAKILKRRKQSVSSLLTLLLKDWVLDNTTGLAAQMGLPTGYAKPTGYADPVEEEIAQRAEDFKVQVIALMRDQVAAVKNAGEPS
jgi:hypothetical protein